VTDIEISYGLANRNLTYGVLEKDPTSSHLRLAEIRGLGVKYLDGAETYGWDEQDIEDILKGGFKVSTKLLFSDVPLTDISDHLFQFIPPTSSRDVLYFHCSGTNDLNENRVAKVWSRLEYMSNALGMEAGFSIYSNQHLEIIGQFVPRRVVVQLPVNPTVDISFDLLNRIASRVVIRSVFLQGLYFAEHAVLSNRILADHLRKQLETINGLAKRYSLTVEEFLLSYIVEFRKNCLQPRVQVILSGANLSRLSRQIDFLLSKPCLVPDIIEVADMLRCPFLSDPRRW